MEPTTNSGVHRWLDVALESISSTRSILVEALTSHWHIFTTRYPGLLEQCIIAIGTAYIVSIGWSVAKLATKVGFASARWCFGGIGRILGLIPEPIFEESESGEHAVDKELYGLEHMALNWTWGRGLKTMWMNMGYWKDTESFPQASENLLNYLLKKAGIVGQQGKVTIDRTISILDLGFGCGDQTLYLTRQLPRNIDVVSYVGITLSKVQYQFAKKRVLEGLDVMDILLNRPQSSQKQPNLNEGLNLENAKPMPFSLANSGQGRKEKISLYNADASNPTSWPSSLHLSLLPPLSPPTSPFSQPPSQQSSPLVSQVRASHVGVRGESHEHWTLGLDSLYHFRPSRTPILKYTHDKLDSNLLAFDLFRPSSRTSIMQTLFLRAFCIAASIPYHNLLTKEEYIHMLVDKVGYHEEDILIKDISDFVFPGLAGFISRRSKEMEKIGIKWKRWAGFKVVAWVIQTGLIRGSVVVARWRKIETSKSVP